MSMNPSQESFLEQMKDMYTQSHLPCCLLNDQFEILWYNKRYRLKRRCRKEAFIESWPWMIFSEEGHGAGT